MGPARALVLINYRRAGIGATSVYYLGANTGRRLSGPRFHRRGPVLSIAPTTTTSNYSVYRTKTLSQQACSIRRLSAPPRRISAYGCIFSPFLTYLSLSSSSSASTVFVFRYLGLFFFFFFLFFPWSSVSSLLVPFFLSWPSSPVGTDSGWRFSTLLVRSIA